MKIGAAVAVAGIIGIGVAVGSRLPTPAPKFPPPVAAQTGAPIVPGSTAATVDATTPPEPATAPAPVALPAEPAPPVARATSSPAATTSTTGTSSAPATTSTTAPAVCTVTVTNWSTSKTNGKTVFSGTCAKAYTLSDHTKNLWTKKG